MVTLFSTFPSDAEAIGSGMQEKRKNVAASLCLPRRSLAKAGRGVGAVAAVTWFRHLAETNFLLFIRFGKASMCAQFP
jgi:hypothetical protein